MKNRILTFLLASTLLFGAAHGAAQENFLPDRFYYESLKLTQDVTHEEICEVKEKIIQADLYNVLKIGSEKEIKEAFRLLGLIHSLPDEYTDDAVQQKIDSLYTAFDVLSNKETRKLYDEYLGARPFENWYHKLGSFKNFLRFRRDTDSMWFDVYMSHIKEGAAHEDAIHEANLPLNEQNRHEATPTHSEDDDSDSLYD